MLISHMSTLKVINIFSLVISRLKKNKNKWVYRFKKEKIIKRNLRLLMKLLFECMFIGLLFKSS